MEDGSVIALTTTMYILRKENKDRSGEKKWSVDVIRWNLLKDQARVVIQS